MLYLTADTWLPYQQYMAVLGKVDTYARTT
jgi:hypothetical protein